MYLLIMFVFTCMNHHYIWWYTIYFQMFIISLIYLLCLFFSSYQCNIATYITITEFISRQNDSNEIISLFFYFQKLFMQKAMSWMNHFHYGIITKYYSYLVILSLKINFQSITKYNHFTWITNYPLELYIKMCLWHWWNIQFCLVGVTLKVFYCQSFFNLCSLIECEL